MLLLYSHTITPRIEYIFRLVIKDLAGFHFQLTDNSAQYLSHNDAKLHYNPTPIDDSPFIQSTSLLFEQEISTIEKLDLTPIADRHLTGLFSTNAGFYSFDIFASAFYFVSFYEQYFSTKKDKHGRYLVKESLLYRNKLLHQAVIHHYALDLRSKILAHFPNTPYQKNKFSALNTIDVDMAYSYKGKGLMRNIGGGIRDLLTGDFSKMKERWNVLYNEHKDPFDTFDFILTESIKQHIPTMFFWLVGNHSQYDKNTTTDYQPFRQLILSISQKATTGIHFSYNSHLQKNGFVNEKKRLENIIDNRIESNRFHYLKYSLPDSFRQITATEIRNDYSIGSAEEYGFTVGMAAPFYFFDLQKNETTSLLLFPFQYMDVTLHTYQKLSADEAIVAIQKMIDETAAVEGQFISLWHNNSLSEKDEWNGWRKVYTFSLEYTQKQLQQ